MPGGGCSRQPWLCWLLARGVDCAQQLIMCLRWANAQFANVLEASLDPKPGVLRKAPFAISLAILLAGCHPQWSISKVMVNPQGSVPLGGTDPVRPVVLVAPQIPLRSEAVVDFEIEIKRDAGFQSPIDISVHGNFSGGNELLDFPHAFTISGTSNHGSGHLMRAFCTRTSGETPAAELFVAVPPGPLPAPSRFDSGFFTDAIVAKTSVDIGVESRISGTNDPMVGWNAPHPLEISCFLTSPIN